MRGKCLFLPFLILFLSTCIFAQSSSFELKGNVYYQHSKEGVSYCRLFIKELNKDIVADSNGIFKCKFPKKGNYQFRFQMFGIQDTSITRFVDANSELTFFMTLDVNTKGQVDIYGKKIKKVEAGAFMDIKVQDAKTLTSAFGDFTPILASLPGVTSNSELSSSYSVRGGSFDENLIYVNGIQIYRPFIMASSQQDGLSFINPYLIDNIYFSTGGWKSRYGDKLSSVLDIQYQKPVETTASASFSLLSAHFHVGGQSKNKRLHFIAGGRQKTSKYLLNTLETNGEYQPKFYDLQSLLSYDLSKKKNNSTEISLLSSYARNRYYVKPSVRETNFGTQSDLKRLTIAFDGTEQVKYDTYQTGLSFKKALAKRLLISLSASYASSFEREYNDIEGGYRLCDLNVSPDGKGANECVFERDLGTVYNNARNSLHAQVTAAESNNTLILSEKSALEFGARVSSEIISDNFREYQFIDSADYISITKFNTSKNYISTQRYSAYTSWNYDPDSSNKLSIGVRSNYNPLNNEWLLSPSLQFVHIPKSTPDLVLKFSTGIYRQPTFYREMRTSTGSLNTQVKSQSAWHVIAGTDYLFKMNGRDFKLLAETYYKYLWNVNPYDIDNLKVRYFASNDAKAYATGVDFRFSGEFIKNTQSWFSLGYMQTKEDVKNDNRGYIRRPTDQRLTLNVFFQDYLPKNPTYKVDINLTYGTGYPFGLPGKPEYRAIFRMPPYRRVDLGMSKLISFNPYTTTAKYFKKIWLKLEVLNILGVTNTISYVWVEDVDGRSYAVPNGLSQRFINFKIIAEL